tara:strand:+ start:61 stop:465 length:405 start_codon:yes stop_codon:yes gene_type:complete
MTQFTNNPEMTIDEKSYFSDGVPLSWVLIGSAILFSGFIASLIVGVTNYPMVETLHLALGGSKPSSEMLHPAIAAMVYFKLLIAFGLVSAFCLFVLRTKANGNNAQALIGALVVFVCIVAAVVSIGSIASVPGA